MAAFFFLSISANRYGGSFRSRSDFMNCVAIDSLQVRPQLVGDQEASDQEACLFGDIIVGVNVLDVVVFVEHIPELAHLPAAVDIEVDVVTRDVAGLGGLGGNPLFLERLAHGLEQLGVAGDLVITVDQFDVVGAGLERDLHQAFLGDVLGIDDEQSLESEQIADASHGAEIAAGEFEHPPELAGGAVAVIGQRLAKHGHAAGSIALVDHFFEVLAADLAGPLLDRALDVVLGDAERACLVDRVAEPHVRRGVATAVRAAT